jgi:anti-anti-sigma regulatory factor
MVERHDTTRNEISLRLVDPLTEETRTQFRKRLEQALEEPYVSIALDLTEVRALPSSWIGSLLLFHVKLKEAGRVLRIKGCHKDLLKVLLLIKLDAIIPIEA